ncbi:hypothetical protein B0H14DRAFT_3494014 [Mycena olivaceomarginata]|nr:hypothetical protein B0H14DRAFT_3494014 [Mycena olivaceomarginata]
MPVVPELIRTRTVLLFPWFFGIGPQPVPLMFRPGEELTLRTDVLKGHFDFSPAHCLICPKPGFKNIARPNHLFTIIPYCWHHPDNAQYAVGRNKSIENLLPPDYRQHTPAGNLMVIKHKGTDGYIQDLPVVDVVPDDHALIVDLIRRQVSLC